MNTAHLAIQTTLQESLEPSYLELLNESHMHAVPENSETHFKLTLVSDKFEGLAPVKRHQMIYALLETQMSNGVHALALHLYTPAQWAKRQESSPESPQCMGGSKAQ
ncbi:transcriptional regulator, BolA protein family [Alteromonadaceae bacterium Bs31]|nr:transcriptional regulator, BolA protein family [Alteromonadaceae bacterium Bs31]